MAHLWMPITPTAAGSREGGSTWVARALDGEETVILAPEADARCRGSVLLMHSCAADGDAWLVMSASDDGVMLNGLPLVAGIRVLRDRDELLVRGLGRCFFSTERVATVEPFAGAAQAMICPRCRQEIAAHTPAVACPRCAALYHQSDALPCWLYAPCALCQQPAHLDGELQWTPEVL